MKRANFPSISRRLTAMNMLVTVPALLIASFLLLAYNLVSIRDAMVRNVNSQATIIATNSSAPLVFNDPDAAEKTLEGLRQSSNIVGATIVTPDSKTFAQYGESIDNALLFPLRMGSSEEHRFTMHRLTVARSINGLDGAQVGTLYLVADLRPLFNSVERYLIIVMSVLAVSLLAGWMISHTIRRKISGPVVSLAAVARRVSENSDFSARAEGEPDTNELNVLYASFNEMMQQIKSRDEALHRMAFESVARLESIPQLVWTADVNGSVEFYNKRWYEYTGMPRPGDPDNWTPYVHEEDRTAVADAWSNSVANGTPYRIQYRLRRADGTYRWQLAHAVPIRDEEGRIQRWFGTCTDIHEQKLAEQALLRSEKIAATGRMAASIAHEINNPLAAVTNVVHLLRQRPQRDPEETELLSILAEEIHRVSHIVKSTLGLSRQSSELIETNLTELIDGVLILFERRLNARGVKIERLYRAEETRALVVPTEIRQVVSNLLANAMDVMGNRPDARLIISMRNATCADGKTRGLRISVADTGPGIPSEMKSRLFEPFFSTKSEMGTGLGLWISKGIIEKHGGTIRFRSRSGAKHGTIFSFTLPLVATAERAQENRNCA